MHDYRLGTFYYFCSMNNTLTPARIVQELDKYIIGQADAKKAVAIALRNRWRRLNAREDIRQEIIPNNIMMIGPTGVGKTEIARRLAQLAEAPFIKVEASKFTEVGYVGRDVESMVRDLVEQSVNMVRTEQKERIKEQAIINANDRILDILIPPVPNARSRNAVQMDEPDLGFKQAEKYSDQELNERTRDKFRDKLLKGELEEREIEIEMIVPSHNVQVVGPMGMEGMDGLQDMLSGMIPKKKKTRKMKIKEAREHLADEEASRLIDMDAVTREAIERAGNSGIIFIDEIDKVAISSEGRGGADVSRQGVQRDLLPIVEGSVVNTKHGSISTDHVLFISAGAFHVAKPSDLIPELQGRFPIRVELNSLTVEDFVKILTQPRNALTRQYQALLESEEVELEFEQPAIELLAEMAYNVNQNIENIGARRLHTIMSNLLDEIMFDVPDLSVEHRFVITRDFVQQKLGSMVLHKDLSQYIL